MKALSFLIFFSMLFTHKSKAQSANSNFPMKEHFDYILKKKSFSSSNNCNGTGTVEYILNCQGGVGSTFADNLGPGLESLIRMFKTTKDKEYLFRFIELGLASVSAKINYGIIPYTQGHYALLDSEYPGWTDLSTVTTHYHDGAAMWPLAHFVYLVKIEEPSLKPITIPTGVIANLPSNLQTFEQAANYFSASVMETLVPHIRNYWENDKGFKQNPTSDSGPAQINQQALMALPVLYMAKVFGDASNIGQEFFGMSIRMGEFFKQTLNFNDKCAGTCLNPLEVNFPVLIENTVNESYYWYSNGWRIRQHNFGFTDCLCADPGEDYLDYITLVEDISHALNVLFFIDAAYSVSLPNWNGAPFLSVTDMVKFRNMFAKSIAVSNNTNPNTYSFKNCVDGTNCNLGPEGDCSSIDGENCFLKEVTAFMPLYNFDLPPSGSTTLIATPPNVYDILMETYQNQIIPDIGNMHGNGNSLFGLAAMVSAQWDRECENLTIYNRTLTYDQNFIVDHNLVINPLLLDENHSSGQNAYALPVFAEDKFVIQTGVHCTLGAGNMISFEGEVEFKAGSEVEAGTFTNNCFSGGRYASTNNNNPNHSDTIPHQPNKQLEIEKSEHSIPQVFVAPNPFTTTLIIETQFTDGPCNFILQNSMGQITENGTFSSGKNMLTLTHLPKGIYFLTITTKEKSFNHKIIKN